MGVEKTMTEAQLREATAPSYESMEDLVDYITCLVERDHDYSTCVYAMSLSAVAAFNHVAKKLGVSGFQASCADLDILKRTRHMKGPFILMDLTNGLYPQYDLPKKLRDAIREAKPWFKEEAKKMLADPKNDNAAWHVRQHWVRLAEAKEPTNA